MNKPYMISDQMMQTIMQALAQAPYFAAAPVIAELHRQQQVPVSDMPMDQLTVRGAVP
jgi:hypothetical protein